MNWKSLRHVITILFIIIGFTVISQTTANQTSTERYKLIMEDINPQRISDTINYLSSLGSRVPGYPGEQKAAEYVEQQLIATGYTNIIKEDVEITTPVDEGASLEFEGKTIAIRALWPNLVRTSQLPPEGVTGQVLYVGDGKIENFNGKDLKDSIVLADFNSGTQWLNAPRLGAKAVIFIEPEVTMRGEAEAKFVSIPINVPRFWISRNDVVPLLVKATSTTQIKATVKCNMRWKMTTSKNIIATLPAPDKIKDAKGVEIDNPYKNQWIVVSSYYDSMSVIPSLAPGAENATGIAAFLELARLWKKTNNVRPVMLIAAAGHYTAMEGIRQYLDKHVDEYTQLTIGDKLLQPITHRKPPTKDIYLWATLDLSSQSRKVGLFYKGYFHNIAIDTQSDFTKYATYCRNLSDKIAPSFGLEGKKLFADGVNAIDGKSWGSYIPGRPAFDCEAINLAGGRSITFSTVDDSRSKVDTPFDTPNEINIPNIITQVKLLACLFDHTLTDTAESATPFPIPSPANFTRMSTKSGFAKVQGRVLRFDPEKSFVPNTPIVNNLALDKKPEDNGSTTVVIRGSLKSYMGVRSDRVRLVDDSDPDTTKKARYEFPGIAAVTAGAGTVTVNAYHMDGLTGEINYAPDKTFEIDYPISVPVNAVTKGIPIVVFRCVPTSIYDLTDPQALRTLSELTILDGETNGVPRMYGSATSSGITSSSYVEDAAVIFSQPGSRLKIVMGYGLGDKRLVLINSSQDVPEGIGYLVGGEAKDAQGYVESQKTAVKDDKNIAQGGTISHTSYYCANDLWEINEWRLNKLKKHKIDNVGVSELHTLSKTYLDAATKALEEKNYADASVYSRASWALEARAYPNVLGTANDVVKGVLLYLALLIPFAFFMERMLFASRVLVKQLSVATIIFVITFVALRFIHPAFEIAGNPAIVFIAFAMFALSAMVSSFIIGKFNQHIHELGKETMGVHTTDIGRMSVAFAAFSLGVSNMRRRKARTFFTCMTLVLVMFIVLSFTSIVSVLRFNEIRTDAVPLYKGLMIRTKSWSTLSEPAYRLMRDEYGASYRDVSLTMANLNKNDDPRFRNVVPRAWYYGTTGQSASSITVQRGDRVFDARGLVGLTSQEQYVTKPQKALVAGRWFDENDTYSAIIPRSMASILKIDDSDVGKASFSYSGQNFLVIGIFDGLTFKQQIKDLDNEPLTPVDFTMSQRMGQVTDEEGNEENEKEFIHLEPDTCFLIPFKTAMNIGAGIRSISLQFNTLPETSEVMDTLMRRLSLNIYAVKPAGDGNENDPGRVVRYSTISATSSKGLETIIIPVIIASLAVLNTMIGAVYERVKEIGILSAIGLAPNHIGMLFFAESLVFAIMGSVIGYFVAQISAKLLTMFPILPGLYLNFSSTSAAMATFIVVGVVLLSTIYPAIKASQVATPAVDRKWKLPEPDGDNWRLAMPFSVTRVQASGLAGFLSEWLGAYEEYSIGDFITQGVRRTVDETPMGKEYRVHCTSWLAPYDLGVSQEVIIESIPTDMKDVYEIYVVINRMTGDTASWKRVNQRFLHTMRKQFLIWRTLKQEQRDRYMAMGETSSEPAKVEPVNTGQ